jgi:HD superfamily phosphohydrolase YqeK
LQKLIFVADKIEPHKAARHPAVARVTELAPRDHDAAMLAYLDPHLVVAAETGWPLHPRTVAARNELIAARRR